jgi:hydrocephalus-inducing protein
MQFVQVVPEQGTVRKNEKFVIELKFQPIAPYKLSGEKNLVHLAISSGPTYTF